MATGCDALGRAVDAEAGAIGSSRHARHPACGPAFVGRRTRRGRGPAAVDASSRHDLSARPADRAAAIEFPETATAASI
jgi:hypothetical protein